MPKMVDTVSSWIPLSNLSRITCRQLFWSSWR